MTNSPSRLLLLLLLTAMLLLSIYIVLLQTYINVSKFRLAPENVFDPDYRKLEYFDMGIYNAVRYLRRNLGPDDKLLTFRLADVAHYTDADLLIHYDPALLDLFTTSPGTEETWHLLREQGVTHVYVPHYIDPSIYATSFQDFLADERLVEMVMFSSGVRIFKVRDNAGALGSAPDVLYSHDFSSASLTDREWTLRERGRDKNPAMAAYSDQYVTISATQDRMPLSRNIAHLYIGRSHPGSGAGLNPIEVQADTPYQIGMRYQGKGYFRVKVHEYDSEKSLISTSPLWFSGMTGDLQETRFQFRTGVATAFVRLEVTIDELSRMDLEHIALSETSSSDVSSRMRKVLMASGWRTSDVKLRIFSQLVDWGILQHGAGNSVYMRVHGGSAQYLFSPVFSLDSEPAGIKISFAGNAHFQILTEQRCGDDSESWYSNFGSFVARERGDSLVLSPDSHTAAKSMPSGQTQERYDPSEFIYSLKETTELPDCDSGEKHQTRVLIRLENMRDLSEWNAGSPWLAIQRLSVTSAAGDTKGLWPTDVPET